MSLVVKGATKRNMPADDEGQARPAAPQQAEPAQSANLHQQIRDWQAIMEEERAAFQKMQQDHETRMAEHEQRMKTLVTMAEQQTHHQMDGQGVATPPATTKVESPPGMEEEAADEKRRKELEK